MRLLFSLSAVGLMCFFMKTHKKYSFIYDAISLTSLIPDYSKDSNIERARRDGGRLKEVGKRHLGFNILCSFTASSLTLTFHLNRHL